MIEELESVIKRIEDKYPSFQYTIDNHPKEYYRAFDDGRITECRRIVADLKRLIDKHR